LIIIAFIINHQMDKAEANRCKTAGCFV
jgi:hypothetical protein